ncbi:hypothetical protein KI655_03335 [Vibrio sp. D404a]|jgi:hypothetical protein|uniref:hypothetical protein n=1 Tax=Vibrio TaxID=662 RepID=UPI0021C294D0|nr:MULTISPECIES: hypothetical protein [Vibrio]MDK9736323.1 hypothetical protein [Vibrio sp. D404a]MDK9795945.1 hypothetical protein [Vibrio sp. D449a]
MQHKEFETLVKAICDLETLPQALELLKSSEEAEVAEAAASLSGQFALAEVENEKRIYHVTQQENEQGEEQEFVEHVMNEGDDLIKFAAWFFDSMFGVKQKETYQTAGKTYRQPKRS